LVGHRLGETRYLEAVERACSYYTAQKDLVDFQTLAHFHAYVLEALIDLDHTAEAARGLAIVAELQRRDGAVPAAPGARWICLPALAQYAVSWFKLGKHEPALRALARLTREQHPSGGFYGSVGRGAHYFPTQEPSWAVKFFLDAQTWRIRTAFDDDVSIFPETVSARDGRLRAIEGAMPEGENLRILDAGCGKGRFAAALHRARPAAEIWGVDVSPAMLSTVADGIHTRRASLLNLPFRDGEFDFTFCVEALEHSVNAAAALRELIRVTRPGGTVLVIDKDARQRGALEIAPWERWFERSEVERWLLEGCDAVSSDVLSDPEFPENLFIAWRGRVREAGPTISP
jgi:malonyl-CoA O-methyltransferase